MITKYLKVKSLDYINTCKKLNAAAQFYVMRNYIWMFCRYKRSHYYHNLTIMQFLCTKYNIYQLYVLILTRVTFQSNSIRNLLLW